MVSKKEKKSCTWFKYRMNITDRYWANSDVTWNALLHIYLKCSLITDVFSYKTSQFYCFPVCFVSFKIFSIYVSTSFKPTSWSMPDIHMYIHTNVHKCASFLFEKKCQSDYFFSFFMQYLCFFKFKQSFFKYAYIFLKKERKRHVFLKGQIHWTSWRDFRRIQTASRI